MSEKKTMDLLSIATIPMVVTLGNSMLIPVLPIIEKKLHVSSFQVSMIITFYSIVAIIFIPIFGFLSDRFGRKIVILPSILVITIGSTLSGWAAWKLNSYPMILVGRFLQGLGAAGTFPVVIPLVGDLFKRKSEVSSGLGIIETANTFGKVLSPILGAYLASLIWFFPFFATSAFCLISFLLILFFLKSPKEKEEPPSFSVYFGSIKRIFRTEGYWLWRIFSVGGICMLVLFGVLFYLSEWLEIKYNIDGVKKGLILALPLGSLCLASFSTGKMIGENNRLMKWITVIGMIVLTLALGSMVFVKELVPLVSILFFGVMGIGVSLPCLDSLITEKFEKEQRGIITSIYTSIRFLGVALGPPLLAYFSNKYGHQISFYLLGAFGLLAVLFFLPFKQKEKIGVK